jgi:hypothetical protein
MLVVAFYWVAFYISVIAWLNAVGHLLQGHLTRAAAWFCVGVGMLLWWNGTETIPHPWDVDAWLKASAWVVGFAAFLTFITFCRRLRHQQAVQTDTPSLNINVEFRPVWDMGDCEVHERRDPGENPVAADRIGRRRPRRAIGKKQSPRRIPGPTIIDQ